ncbi:MAG: RNA polymerase factor sigma-54 [Spirochaetes bacterium]|uniref:RNA polymerase factor sigma-54 n=1 Tax=Candidatus Ornithospirochaeta stercoripullorum TaxID=2840899 RepID=A0A9D9DYP7_9SPIO|nr:RNA polymerase factor sigma-54 [Candidatus Ornithospirochaeta stercoripullorum]
MIQQGLELSQKQELKLSVQLIQTMEILSLSTEELREKIKKEAETNPVIVVNDRTASYDRFANEYRNYTDRRESYGDNSGLSDNDKKETNWIESIISSSETLQQHLLTQLGEMKTKGEVKKTAETLITALDNHGFFPAPPESIVKEKDLAYVHEAVSLIQSMDPSGVGAMDARDSLIIQARNKGISDEELSILTAMIYDKLEELNAGKLDAVAKALKTDKEEIEALLGFLRTLTLYPASGFSSGYENYIIPELSIKKENGVLTLHLLNDSLPSVSIDHEYEELAEEYKNAESREGKEAEKFIRQNLNSAKSLISQLEMRASTLERTGAVLMDKQRDFFMKGPLYLKGLTMQSVADEIGVHEATVSRIASSKYIDTDFGIWPMRSFFSAAVKSENDSNLSRNAVKEMIRKIIDENMTGKALSDQKISDILKERGITAARRTVSKYRHELDIDSSFSRSK